MPVVAVVYKTLPKYRIPFFESIRHYLAERGVEFRLLYGEPPPEERSKNDTGHISWAQRVPNRIIAIGSRSLYWQPCLHLLKDCNLVIVEQASKLLLNYVLLARQFLGGPRVALWGHGRSFRVHRASIFGEAVKRSVSHLAHWCFAYNETSAAEFRRIGIPQDRLTIVQNAVDTTTFIAKRDATTEQDLMALRVQLGLLGDNVAIFAGGLYSDKRVDFLLQAAFEIRKRIHDFELLVMGAGPEERLIRQAEQIAPWIRYVGTKFGAEKVPYFLLAKAMLLPGTVGLAVVDSFVFRVPLVTIHLPFHGPEIEYLNHGVNGLMCDADTTPGAYAEAVATVLGDQELRSRLREGCRLSAKRYTLEAMVERFGRGVLLALKSQLNHGSPKGETEVKIQEGTWDISKLQS
jgi:glycosyltransferase involved in cell wall biosynthesis